MPQDDFALQVLSLTVMYSSDGESTALVSPFASNTTYTPASLPNTCDAHQRK